ncbi:MAG: hybrid sensor histidine kinase/response regulator [Bacteroidetes bacterium]|nr:hybrid sensor histidine kinase/response regulator [Bacteroidota bacterium]
MADFESNIKQIPTLLVVDDTEDNLDLLEFALKKKPIHMLRASSGMECLEIALREQPDIILLDIQMPEMDGFQTMERLRADPRTAKIPVIFLTAAKKDPQSIAQGILAGAEEYLTKPIDVDELIARVRSIYKVTATERELQKLRSQFMAMLVHDLRTPLTVILGGVDYILGVAEDHQPLDQDAKDILVRMMNSTSGMINLVNELLDLSKYEAGQITLEKKPMFVQDFLSRSLHLVKLQFKRKQIQLETSIEPNLPPINIDAKKFEQVISNLLGNALKFTPKGGTVTVSAKCDSPGKHVHIEVTDNGVGMKPEELTYLFEHYRQVSSSEKTKEKGTGLGLAICKLIVTAHGGTISVVSEEGKGSTFTVAMPVSNAG